MDKDIVLGILSLIGTIGVAAISAFAVKHNGDHKKTDAKIDDNYNKRSKQIQLMLNIFEANNTVIHLLFNELPIDIITTPQFQSAIHKLDHSQKKLNDFMVSVAQDNIDE